jgi:hypothetical protein
MIAPFEHSIPVDIAINNKASDTNIPNEMEGRIASYVVTWRNQCRSVFIQRRNIWDDCWKLYRGLDDWSNREDWQSRIVLPKSWASVKMATNTIKRLLQTSKKPWNIESINPDDLVGVLRAEQMTDLTRVFMDKAHFLQEFTEGLECGFILGLGVWKIWWGLVPRRRTRVETQMIQVPAGLAQQSMGQGQQGGPAGPGQPGAMNAPGIPGAPQDQGHGPQAHPDVLNPEPAPQQVAPPFAQSRFGYKNQDISQYPPQLPGENLAPQGWGGPAGGGSFAPPSMVSIPTKKIVQEEINEGQLFIRAVDPYNFYWLPGSKLNRWVGTIEEVEIPKWELIRLAKLGLFSEEKIDQIQTMRIDERYKMSNLRFSETVMMQNGPNRDTAVCKLTEFYGPIVFDGKILSENAHVILANDSVVLLYQDRNPFLHQKPPYVGYSPLSLPFRTEGVGLVEMVRNIDKALSQLANLSVDTLMFRLLPLFEVAVDAFENPEDLETGIVPGKILRKNMGSAGVEGIRPVKFEDVSTGTVQVAGLLDRSHQEGALISDIAEGMPRWRGQQTATESQLLQQQSESFMGSMAGDIEKQALEPMVNMAMDLIFQFIDTANDPRVASILGVGADVLNGMGREEIMEMIQGDYKVKAIGITGQIQKTEMLQNLVQFMNLIGQNPQAWLPYINQDALLRRILEAFRPNIHDIEDIISDPAFAEAKRVEMQQQEHGSDMINLIPQLLQHQREQQATQQDQSLQLQKLQHEKEMAQMDQQTQMAQLAHQQQVAQGQLGIQQQEANTNQQKAQQQPQAPQGGQ